MTRHWIIVASRDHVLAGVAGGFGQACHGKASPLHRMQPGDGVIYYSPRVNFGGVEKLQRFTAIGRVVEGPVVQVDMGSGFIPFRRGIEFQRCQEVEIVPLLPELTFIRDKQRWGALFRFGMLEIPATDYERIADRMLRDLVVIRVGT